MTITSTRRPLKIFQDDISANNDSVLETIKPKNGIPLAARTRSMTRLSSHSSSTTIQSKLARLDRVSRGDKENSNPAVKKGVKRTLTEKMLNTQVGFGEREMDGLKRKANLESKNGVKRQRTSQESLRALPLNNAVEPVTPVRGREQVSVVQPTPARDLLKSKPDMEEDDDEVSPEISSRFIARPPTPPRPHMSLVEPQEEKNQVNNDMQVDSPTRPLSNSGISTTPTKTPNRIKPMAPVTPRNNAFTPKRVMGSVSKFRTGQLSVKKPSTTPIVSPNHGRPMLSSLLEITTEINDKVSIPQIDHDMDQNTEEDVSAPTISPVKLVMPDVPTVNNVAVTPSGSPTKSSEDNVDILVTDPADSMPPPSRLPRPTMAPLLRPREAGVSNLERPKQSSIPVLSKTASSISTLGRGLPTSAPSTLPSMTGDTAQTRRKPSYPSSLGSGPLARPRDRMVSGPTLYTQKDGSLSSKKEEVPQSKRQSPRSVSEPSSRPRPSLSASTGRREGLSLETSKSLAGLADALKTLRMKKPDEPKTLEKVASRTSLFNSSSSTGVLTPSTTVAAPPPPASNGFTTSRLSGVHRPRNSIQASIPGADESMKSEEGEHPADVSLAAIVSSTAGEGCLKGVVAFVDVKTTDGEDASSIFSDMLKALGARVISRLTDNVTHIVYKSGRPTTLSWYRKQEEDERPHIVGLSWVTKCKQKGERLDEAAYLVKVADEDVFQKRRKSMEPKALMQSTLSNTLNTSLSLASIKRQSMMYAPKISSPLKKGFRAGDDE